MSKPVQTLTPLECESLLSYFTESRRYVTSTSRQTRNLLATLLMLDAGLRVGELVQLQTHDLYMQGASVTTLIVRSETTKTHTERRIPLSRRLMASIETAALDYWPHPHLPSPAFYTTRRRRSRPITPRQIQRMIATASLQTIGREIHPHVLRHTFATRLMTKTNIRVVQELLGHKSIQSTQIYTHPNSTDLRSAIDAM